MGRKSKKSGDVPPVKPTCFYCQRSFENEDVLVSHQKLLHFRCPDCGKKFGNAPGMGIHMKTMHNTELKAVPKAEPGRDDPTLHIVGTVGVPTEEEREESNRKRMKLASSIDSLIDSVAAEAVVPQIDIADLPPVKGMVYTDETVSPEEKRAMLPRYRFDENNLKDKLSAMDASIETRLKEALARKMQRV